MNHTIFETRQRAEELLKEAIAIWRQGTQSDALEGLEEDPVFFLLMSALAYQANSFDSELERLKTDVLEDYLHTLRPYGLGHAIPAVAVVKAPLQANLAELDVKANNLFTLGNTGYTFMPLLASKAVNLSVQSIVRLDGRRWKVSLKSPHLISDLSYFSFAVSDSVFSTLSVSIKGKALPLIHPWQYADLPFNECFSVDNLLYNRRQVFNPAPVGLDLFARQNIRVYHVRPCNLKRFLPAESDQLELVFEFSGIRALPGQRQPARSHPVGQESGIPRGQQPLPPSATPDRGTIVRQRADRHPARGSRPLQPRKPAPTLAKPH